MQRNVTVASTLNETLKDNTCEEDTYALSEWDMVYQTTQSYSQVETFWGCTQQMNPNTWAYYNTLMGALFGNKKEKMADGEVVINDNRQLRIPARVLNPTNVEKAAYMVAEHRVKKAKIENPAGITDDQVVTAATRALEATIGQIVDRAVDRAMDRYQNNTHARALNQSATTAAHPIVPVMIAAGFPPNFPATRQGLEDATAVELQAFCAYYGFDDIAANAGRNVTLPRLKNYLGIPL